MQALHRLRWIAAIAFSVIAIVSVLASGSLYFSRKNPSMAIALWSGNSIARGNLAANMIATDQSPATAAKARLIADRVLRSQPGNVLAAQVMALSSAAKDDEVHAWEWLHYGESQSRRDLGTQLMLIEYYVTQSDIDATLKHYDRALKTSPESYAQLFPILAAAAADPKVANALIAVLRQRPSWSTAFLPQLAAGPTPYEIAAPIIRRLRLDANKPAEREILNHIIVKGVAAKRFADARRFLPYPGNSIAIRNGGFEAANSWPPFDWALADDAELAGIIEPGSGVGGGNALFLEARNGRSGEVARQALVLLAARYRLTLAVGDVTGTTDEHPAIVIQCVGVDQPLLDARLPTTPTTGQRVHFDFAVPSGCNEQWLSIRASDSDGDGEGRTRPWVDDIAITRNDALTAAGR